MIEEIFFAISKGVEAAAFAIMIYGMVLACIMFIKNELRRFNGKFDIKDLNAIRLDFSYYILLGLEFLIAADIIETILKPTNEELIELGGIVAIRVLLSFFLTKEINDLKSKQQNQS